MNFRWRATQHELLHPRRPDDICAHYGVAVAWPWERHVAPTVWVEVHDRRVGLAQPVAALGLVEPCTVWDAMTLLRAFGWFHEHVGIADAADLLGVVEVGTVVEHLQPIETALEVLRALAADLRNIEAERT